MDVKVGVGSIWEEKFLPLQYSSQFSGRKNCGSKWKILGPTNLLHPLVQPKNEIGGFSSPPYLRSIFTLNKTNTPLMVRNKILSIWKFLHLSIS